MADGSSRPFDQDDENPTSDSDHSDARDTTETTETTETTGETPPNPEAEAGAEDPQEGAVPPGYDWPTHGGYLGCLLSLIASCLIGGFLGTTLFAALGYSHAVPKVVAAVLTVVVYLGVTVGLGRLGWVLGKRFYREYPQTRPENPDQSGAHPSSSSAVDMPIDTR